MQFSRVPSASVTSQVAQVLHQLARAADRAIRRLEDRHRGELPYMRRMENQCQAAPLDLAQTLNESEAAARTAERASLDAVTALAVQHSSATAAAQLKCLADDAAAIATAYYSLKAEVVDQPALTRGEPVWAGGLTVRLSAFAQTCAGQAASGQACSTTATTSAMISVS